VTTIAPSAPAGTDSLRADLDEIQDRHPGWNVNPIPENGWIVATYAYSLAEMRAMRLAVAAGVSVGGRHAAPMVSVYRRTVPGIAQAIADEIHAWSHVMHRTEAAA
jgi:hypothetical protein